MSNARTITVKITPKASKNEVVGWIDGPDNQKILKCTVTAVPDKGKANKALIALLAKHYRVSKSSITITRGLTSRNKTVLIQTDKQKS